MCTKIHGDKPAYLLFMYDKPERWGVKLKPSNLTTRNKRVYKGATRDGLIDFELAARAGGINQARNAAQANTMQQDLPAQKEIERSREMGRTGRAGMVTGRESYNRDRQDREREGTDDSDVERGTFVSLTNLNSPRGAKLNGSSGIVVDYDSKERRYRVNLDTGQSGLFKKENLMVTNSVFAFTDLLK